MGVLNVSASLNAGPEGISELPEQAGDTPDVCMPTLDVCKTLPNPVFSSWGPPLGQLTKEDKISSVAYTFFSARFLRTNQKQTALAL